MAVASAAIQQSAGIGTGSSALIVPLFSALILASGADTDRSP